MRGHRTSSGRSTGRAACLGFLLFAWALGRSALGDDGPGAGRGERTTNLERAMISATADRVRHWEEEGVHFALLEGHAAVFRGDDQGIRSDSAVIRIFPRQDEKGSPPNRVDIYAAGKVRRKGSDARPLPELRESWKTLGRIDLAAGTEKDLVNLPGRPSGVALLAGAFPRPSVEAEAPREPAQKKAVAPEPIAPPGVTIDESVRPTAADEKPDKNDREKNGRDVLGERPIRFRDPAYRPVQFIEGRGFPDEPGRPTAPATPAPRPVAPPDDFGPSIRPPRVDPPVVDEPPPRRPAGPPNTGLDPLPGMAPGRPPDPDEGPEPVPTPPPILTGTQRIISIYGRSGPLYSLRQLQTAADGTNITIIQGGVNLVMESPQIGLVDIEADDVIIWQRPKPGGKAFRVGPSGEVIENAADPLEIYMEGHVVFRQDRRQIQGTDDQASFRANRAYYDVPNDRHVSLDSQLDLFAPGLIAPFKVSSPRIDAFHPTVAGPGGAPAPSSFQEIRARQTVSTGSRFANPGYRFTSRSFYLNKVISDNAPPIDFDDSNDDARRTTWRLESRQNLFFMGPVPVFYWPRFLTDVDDLDPPLRQIAIRANNYFGQQVLLDWNGFKLFNLRKPVAIDTWNIDTDYLSARKSVALGSELGWSGKDPVYDFLDPYHRRPNASPSIFTNYAGYVDAWAVLNDRGYDDLGSGPAIITDNPAAGRLGFQRLSFPSFNSFRGRFNQRHMQSFLTDDSDPFEDARINFENGFLSDRNFLEQYYKRLFDIGLDHETLVYGIRQKQNWAATFLAEVNPNVFNTETQWAPKLDYYRLGDSLLGNSLTYFQHTGVDWANTHTANDVNNKNIFAFIPFDPVSNTSGSLRTGRAYTAHEVDAPFNLGFIRVVPYVQGQAVGWDHQINGNSVGRIWGAAGARADIMAWNKYPDVESELLNVHGFNHKVDFFADYRDAWSNVGLNQIGVQDDLDDNTYEQVRRYFALANYGGGLLPIQYDPRFLLLRRMASPIGSTTDVQATMETLHLGIHQRLQTKRGPEGKRRIIDYMTLDLDTTYFPMASRDNFGKPFGQNTYNWEWFIGDRTSITSYGWFEFWNIEGDPLGRVVSKSKQNPLGLDIITTGINITRPPRGNIFFGYSVIDTGLIQTSALNASFSYWLSPKWYTSAGTSYDFANAILLAANFSLTRVGKDYFVSAGLQVDPQRRSYMFAFEIVPRLSPQLHLGSGGNLTRLDSRYAPVQ